MSKLLLLHHLLFSLSRVWRLLLLFSIWLAINFELLLLFHHLLLELILGNHLLFLPCTSCTRCCPYFKFTTISLNSFWSWEWSQMRIDIAPSPLRRHYFSRSWTSSWFLGRFCSRAMSISRLALSNFMSTHWMEEVRIFAVPVTISCYCIYNFSVSCVLVFPCTCTVLWISPLQPTKKLSVIIGDLSDFLYSVCSVQTIVSIKSARIGIWLLSRIDWDMSWRLQINLKHLS